MVLLGGKFGEGVANQKAIPNLNPGWLFYIDFFIYLIIYLLIFSQWAEKSPLPLRFSPAPYPVAEAHLHGGDQEPPKGSRLAGREQRDLQSNDYGVY